MQLIQRYSTLCIKMEMERICKWRRHTSTGIYCLNKHYFSEAKNKHKWLDKLSILLNIFSLCLLAQNYGKFKQSATHNINKTWKYNPQGYSHSLHLLCLTLFVQMTFNLLFPLLSSSFLYDNVKILQIRFRKQYLMLRSTPYPPI